MKSVYGLNSVSLHMNKASAAPHCVLAVLPQGAGKTDTLSVDTLVTGITQGPPLSCSGDQ